VLTVAKLLEALQGLDADAQVVVGIINGPAYNAAHADQEVRGTAVQLSAERFELRGEAPVLYVCCYEQPRPWEGPPLTLAEDGTAALEFDPEDDPERPQLPPVE
jgi:hypothetical protein